MLIRLIIDNYLSFGDRSEFNCLPGKQTRLSHHKYQLGEIDFLKLTGIYGANGAGKSNLVSALGILKDIVVTGEIPGRVFTNRFKLNNDNLEKGIVLGVEFINESTPFIYAIEINKGRVDKEELYISGLGDEEDKLLFERSFDEEGQTEIKFADSTQNSEEGDLVKNVISKSLKNSVKPFLYKLNELEFEHPIFDDIRLAFNWFEDKLFTILPNSKPGALVLRFIEDENFRKFTKKMMCSFQTGIKNIDYESKNVREYLGENEKEDIVEIEETLRSEPDSVYFIRTHNEEIVVTNEDGDILAHRLYFEHHGGNTKEKFYVSDESDGTQRLLDYIPTFEAIINNECVYVIDEIERSIHPLIVKGLLRKFSNEENTKGQVVFTTHETHLLDQEIFRQDEIWFVEKDSEGKSHMYPLSQFKEHHTLDIEKGYLTGRYGAIPFLGNLNDLNW